MPEESGAARFWFVVFVNDPATTEICALSVHDALPISRCRGRWRRRRRFSLGLLISGPRIIHNSQPLRAGGRGWPGRGISVDHTSQLPAHLHVESPLLAAAYYLSGISGWFF